MFHYKWLHHLCNILNPTHRFSLLHVVHVKVLVLPGSDDELPPVGREVCCPYGVVFEVHSLMILHMAALILRFSTEKSVQS